MSVVDISPPPEDDSEPSEPSEGPPSPDYIGNVEVSATLTAFGLFGASLAGFATITLNTALTVFLTGFLALMLVDTVRLLAWHRASPEGWL